MISGDLCDFKSKIKFESNSGDKAYLYVEYFLFFKIYWLTFSHMPHLKTQHIFFHLKAD